MKKVSAIVQSSKLSVSRVAVLGMILALLIAIKYVLGVLPGVELVSFSFICLGIFLPIIDLSLLIMSFNFLVLVLYGFGSWWIVYWVIWPIDAFVAKLISRFTRNRYCFAAWGFLAGAFVFMWYFMADLMMFGPQLALLILFQLCRLTWLKV